MRILSLGAEWMSVRAGGLNRYTAGLAEALQCHQVAQQWLVMGDARRPPRGASGVEYVGHSHDPMWHRWRGVRTSFASALARRPDVVASHFAPYSYPVCRQLRGLPHVVHFHGPWADESAAEGARWFSRRLKWLIERSTYRTANRFITLSQAFARLLVARYRVDPDLVRVIPGGVDVRRFATELSRRQAREVLGWEPHRPIVVAVRRLVHRTGVAELIQGVDRVRKSHPDMLLMVAGTGPMEALLREQVVARGLARHVRLLGFVGDDQLPLVYRAADFSVLPSQLLEGFGLSAAESLAAGTPVVVTPVGGLPEVVSPLGAHLVTTDPSAQSIAERLEEVLAGKLDLPTPETCRAYAQERLGWTEVASAVLDVYREALEN